MDLSSRFVLREWLLRLRPCGCLPRHCRRLIPNVRDGAAAFCVPFTLVRLDSSPIEWPCVAIPP